MRRIRLALLLVALGLGIPVAVLAYRALDGLALERAVRHQAVAERVFDEMERALSTWLAEEEARPFEHYRFYAAPDRRSPLAAIGEDFVVGAFQVDPDGSVHTPLRPRDRERAEARGDWPPSDPVLLAIERVTRVASETWKDEVGGKAQDVSKREAKKDARQDPGTTRPIAGPLASKAGKEGAAFDAEAGDEDNVYDVLQRFNRGADARAQRKQKIAAAKVPAPQAPSTGFLAGEAAEAAAELERPAEPSPVLARVRPEARASAAAGSAPVEVLADSAASAPEPSGSRDDELAEAEADGLALNSLRALGYVVSEELAPAETRSEAPPPSAPRRASPSPADDRAAADLTGRTAEVRLALDPMVGRETAAGELLLYRTVLVGEQGYRQGLLLDRTKLGAWLTERALEPAGLASRARVDFRTTGATDDGGAFQFEHRFAEPFDALSARLSLAALPGVGSPGAIYGLVGLLAVVGLAGLLAIHRMVGVAVHFAERRSNFVSAVTHELKTPLTAIRMYAEMLRDGLVPNEAKKSEYYGTITDESERLSRLIDNVLEFSKLERGTREMNWSVGSVEPVVREAAEKLRAHAEHEGFALEVAIEPELPPVRYDRDALLQVLFNLVDNAMKYGGASDTRRVVIEASRHEGGVQLAVRDFGPGVSGRHLARIFEPFYRGEDELTRSAKGTGIGLALVRDLSERMGAAVRGTNVPDGGFRVCVAFEAAQG